MVLGIVMTVVFIVIPQGITLGLDYLAPLTAKIPGFGLLVSFGLTWLMVWVWVRFKEGRRFRTLGFSRPRLGAVLWPIVIAIGGMSAIVAVNVVTGTVTLSVPAPTVDTVSFVGLFLLIVFVQAGGEEVLFRGFLAQSINRKAGLAITMAGQAVLFGLVHLISLRPNVAQVIGAIIIGVALGLWVLLDGNLWGAIAFHVVWNWSQMVGFGSGSGSHIITLTPVKGAAPFLGGPGLQFILVTVILAGCLGIALYRRRRAGRRRLSAPIAAHAEAEPAMS